MNSVARMIKNFNEWYWNNISKGIIRPHYINSIRKKYDYSHPLPSLITSNCIGGEIYNDLGIRFMSPTINLWFEEEDFIKLAKRPRYYFSLELEFITNPRNEDYPVARLDDILVYFLHYSSEKEAKVKWNERCSRIQYDNMYLIMSDLRLSDESYRTFADIKGYKKKILFTTDPCKRNDSDVFYIKYYMPNSYVRKYAVNRLNGFRDFELFFDFVSWLCD